jgi:hypothetical protein
MKLFFVCCTDSEGDNQDLLVEAPCVATATRIWHDYFSHEALYGLGEWPVPDYVGEIKLTGTMGAIGWASIIPSNYVAPEDR